MWRDGTHGTGQQSSRHGTGWDSQSKIKRDGTWRDQQIRDTGQDGTTFWSSRGALGWRSSNFSHRKPYSQKNVEELLKMDFFFHIQRKH
jgi:hypothetical protein